VLDWHAIFGFVDNNNTKLLSATFLNTQETREGSYFITWKLLADSQEGAVFTAPVLWNVLPVCVTPCV
jgi:hypothetical protein